MPKEGLRKTRVGQQPEGPNKATLNNINANDTNVVKKSINIQNSTPLNSTNENAKVYGELIFVDRSTQKPKK